MPPKATDLGDARREDAPNACAFRTVNEDRCRTSFQDLPRVIATLIRLRTDRPEHALVGAASVW
jgi:hypothetical protein